MLQKLWNLLVTSIPKPIDMSSYRYQLLSKLRLKIASLPTLATLFTSRNSIECAASKGTPWRQYLSPRDDTVTFVDLANW